VASRRDKRSIHPGGRQSALTAIERHQVGLLRAVGGRASSILRIAEQMGRTREAVRSALESVEAKEAMSVARAVMERNAANFALDWTVASQVAASLGNHRPARDALGAVGVVRPDDDHATTSVTVNIPFMLGALADYRPPGGAEAANGPTAINRSAGPPRGANVSCARSEGRS
jgi:hypothetical protein